MVNKQEFLAKLRKGLYGLPQNEVEERLAFYSEMIDDRIEEGLSEEEAVLAVGTVEKIVEQVVGEIPLAKIAKERILPKRRLNAAEISLLAIGSPIWFSFVISVAAVIFSVYASLWAIVVSLWSVFASLAVCGVAGLPACIIFFAGGNATPAIFTLALGLVSSGLSVFTFYGCIASTKGMLIITKKLSFWIKNCFIKKGDA